MSDDGKQGWGFPLNSKKAHYFWAARSLCGKWGFWGELDEGIHNDHKCKDCQKRLAAHYKTVNKETP